jgi:8-oxo-dGTP diphosphatase
MIAAAPPAATEYDYVVPEDIEVDLPWIRPAAHGVAVRDGHVLLTRFRGPDHPEDGWWGLPGGGLDWGEHPEEALRREVREETGLSCHVERILGVFSTTYLRSPERPRHSIQILSILHVIQVGPGDPTPEPDPKSTTDAAAWVPLTELGNLPLGEMAIHALGLVGIVAG